jgi:hypothetical protein
LLSMAKPKSETKSQRERFIETARELGCDEDEAAFDEKLRRIATATPKSAEKTTAHPEPTRFWRIEGYDGTRLFFRKILAFGSLSEPEMITLLKRLASRHLTDDEIIAASIRSNARGYAPHLEHRVDSPATSAKRYALSVG